MASAKLGDLISDQLLSPFEIKLPADLLRQAQEFVDASFFLRQRPEYQTKVLKAQAAIFPEQNFHDPGNHGIAMSYDFHLSSDGVLKLIEINTNAAFLAMSTEMYEFRCKSLPIADFSALEIRADVLREVALQKKNSLTSTEEKNLTVAIVDEEPSQQRLFIEFLVYQEWFKSWGWKVQIQDVGDPLSAAFIYNRSTDFYFQDTRSQQLKQLFQSGTATVSPQPYEYMMLADKERMVEWSQPSYLHSCGLPQEKIQVLQRHLPQAFVLDAQNADSLWQQRKSYFFKPLRAFGAKQSYRGASISRKNFDELTSQGFLAQEFVPAPERIFTTPEGEQSFKFDLRFYAYQNRVQSVVARLYQGQVTNLRTPYGGFAPVNFSN